MRFRDPGEKQMYQEPHVGSTSTKEAPPDSMNTKKTGKSMSPCPHKVARCTTWWQAGENVDDMLKAAP